MPDAHRRAIVDALATTTEEALVGNLRLEDDPMPDVARLAPDDVLVRVRSANVGWVDVLMMTGQYQHVPEPPYTPGLEFAGEVVAHGSAVTQVELGASVIADGLLTGPRSLGAHRAWGGFASWAIAPAVACIPLPHGFSFDEGACLLGGAETAYHALVYRARVQPGELVLVLGATGSTGLAAVALAKLLGAMVVAVGRNADKLAITRAHGADHIIATEAGEPLREQLKRITGGRGADVVYDGVGGPLSALALRACAFGARFVVVGWASTPRVARGGREANVLPTNLILMKGIDVLGSPAAIAVHREPALRHERLARILEWAAAGHLKPHVSAAFPLAQLHEVLQGKWHGRFAGNVVVHP